jgi:hypothetical protein
LLAEEQAAMSRKDYKAALQVARQRQAVRDGPNIRSWIAWIEAASSFDEGEILVASGDLEGALRRYRRAEELSPGVLTEKGRRFVDNLAKQVEDRKTLAAINPVMTDLAATFQGPPTVSGRKLDFVKPTSEPALAFANSVTLGVSGDVSNEQIATIVRGVRTIRVPPPILPQDAAIGIARLAERDDTSKRVLLGLEAGIAVAAIAGRIGEASLPYVKLILVGGKSIIAAEEGADVFLVRQNEVYERALQYLKDESRRKEFTELVRALKERRPLAENTDIEMARAAQAIIDPSLGNSNMRIAWNSMLSAEARRAAVTQACIQLGAEIIGLGAGKAFQRIQATQFSSFREAEDFLARAAVAMNKVTEPAAKASLQAAIDQANHVIASTYHTVRPSAQVLEATESIIWAHHEEEFRTEGTSK